MRINKLFFSIFCFVFLIVGFLFVQKEYLADRYTLKLHFEKNADPVNAINKIQLGDIKKVTKIGDNSYEVVVKSSHEKQFLIDMLKKNHRIISSSVEYTDVK